MPVTPIAQFMLHQKKGLILSCSHINFIDASCTNSKRRPHRLPNLWMLMPVAPKRDSLILSCSHIILTLLMTVAPTQNSGRPPRGRSCSHINLIDASCCTNSKRRTAAVVLSSRPIIVIHLLMPVAQFKTTKETHNNFIDASCTNSKGRFKRAIIILFVASCTDCPIYEGWCQLHQLPNLRRRKVDASCTNCPI